MLKVLSTFLLFSFFAAQAQARVSPLEELQTEIRKILPGGDISELTKDLPVPAMTTDAEEAPQAAEKTEEDYFNQYVSKAVLELYSNYGLKGYDISSVLTHDINYHTYGVIKARNPPLTMCVAAQLEIILTAYRIYAEETGDYSVYDYLPKSSYEKLGINDLKGHIWVNHEFNSYGTADALINFGMGERATFDNLKAGAFVNINRTTGTGHAVTFIGYIDKEGILQSQYDGNVIGFRYFSSQGLKEEGKGGFDYRNAIFSKYGCPEMDFKRDCNVIYSESQVYLNTGMMLMPRYWKLPKPSEFPVKDTVFDGKYFNGEVTDY
ncbi:MAG: hypothetical protein COT17_00965 [Elusimicrobia bacterium CG08_land_8_20_14_0_20_51_18]|nr:MAG: hypothetical protein COT17_00965 [Elusimicrobia bacterium CG08_land_8_20_14_0_20_51_18]